MENELLVLNTEEVNESENLNYDELEELLEQQFTMEFSNLEKLEVDCKEISSPDKLGDVILDEIWNQFGNQIGLDMTSDTLLKQYNEKNPNGYTKEIADQIVKDKRYTDANKAMKHKQKLGNLKDEYTGKKLKINEKANLDHIVPRKQIFENPWRKIADIDPSDLANKSENLSATNESLNKSKGAKSNSDYIKNKELRERNLREQVKKANEKIDKMNISDAEKRNLKAENNKRLNDKLAADSKKMLKAEKTAKKAINKDIAKKASVRMANKAGKDAIKAMFVAALFGMLKEIMNALVRYFKAKKQSFDTFMEEMKKALHSFFGKIKDFIKVGVDSFVGSIVGEIIGAFNQKLQKLPNLIKQLFGSIRESISYLSNPENQTHSTAIKIAHISKIITSGLVAVGAMFLGEYFEQFLNKVPGMTFEIKLLGTIANILGMFFASLLTGILGAIIINGLDQFISKKLIEENQKKQANKKNELLRIQDVQIFVAEQNVAVKRNDIFIKMAKNHQKLRELLGNVQEEFSNSKIDFKQRLLANEIYFDEKQSELEEMQSALNDLL
ncbi:hypothetical protein HMPREF2764_04260 [Streptococcus sp. HMSC073F11]|uniref:Cation diffusion facilitator family transporter n=1 Tax=Streptococcus oralis TaxID=1303 RepID=A0AAW5WGU0_STROR|nr:MULTISPECIES: hypothetical protein [Streptococcus]AHZ47582.1 hypothetical protein V470_03910 [Streptococcus sp. VT 162]MCY7059733.1 hypothetical protein [Streptococcus oralis]OFL55021.1 hypothetical protein HMPREF2764_04260 [Streptococcus sp. HMSC073F11]OHQ20290.1 hypothetical protein HMPREF2655_07865 [Streptococcus sp. HMSC066F01]